MGFFLEIQFESMVWEICSIQYQRFATTCICPYPLFWLDISHSTWWDRSSSLYDLKYLFDISNGSSTKFYCIDCRRSFDWIGNMTSIMFLSFYLSLHTWFDLHVQLLGFKFVPKFEEENCRNLYCTTSIWIWYQFLFYHHSVTLSGNWRWLHILRPWALWCVYWICGNAIIRWWEIWSNVEPCV